VNIIRKKKKPRAMGEGRAGSRAPGRGGAKNERGCGTREHGWRRPCSASAAFFLKKKFFMPEAGMLATFNLQKWKNSPDLAGRFFSIP